MAYDDDINMNKTDNAIIAVEEHRQRIILALKGGPKTPGKLAILTNYPGTKICHHLRVLLAAELVEKLKTERRRRHQLYQLTAAGQEVSK